MLREIIENGRFSFQKGSLSWEEAIKKALSLTDREGDAVILAGKGADAYQIVQGKKVPYPGDYALAEKYL